MKNSIIVTILFLLSHLVQAQFIKEKSINAQMGFGSTVPYYSNDEIADNGFFAQGEFVLTAASWIDFRPYAGLIITNSNGKDLHDNPTEELAESKALLLGGKVRIKAPIPYVAPYLELGIGTSVGRFETQTAYSSFDETGIVYHIPLSFGLELGKRKMVDLGLVYFYQPSVEQFAGAVAAGFSIPINAKNNVSLAEQ